MIRIDDRFYIPHLLHPAISSSLIMAPQPSSHVPPGNSPRGGVGAPSTASGQFDC